jgi:hypothetical protein
MIDAVDGGRGLDAPLKHERLPVDLKLELARPPFVADAGRSIG